MPVNVWILLAGLAILLVLKWFRNRFRAWPQSAVDSFTVGYFFPALGVALVLMGVGGFAERPGRITDNPLNLVLNGLLAAGLLMLLVAVATIFGLRLPAVFLPRWLRLERQQAAAGGVPASASAADAKPGDELPGLVLVDRSRQVTLTLPGSTDRWVVGRTPPPGTVIEASTRNLPPSGYRPRVRVTTHPGGQATAGGDGPADEDQDSQPVSFAGRDGVRTTRRGTQRGVPVVTWTWTARRDGTALTLAITCAAAEAATQADEASRIAATLSWEPEDRTTTGPTA